MVHLRSSPIYVLETIFRWVSVPIEPGLIEFGHPDENSPVFLTCNYDLTVRRVIKYLKKLDCYLLVAPSNGINVWCSSCGGEFTEHSVISVIKTTDINEKVKHRTLIVPQLSAPGIDVEKVKQETGWQIKFGPVYAKDIPKYVKNEFKKTAETRTVKFDAKDRVEMASVYFFTLATIFVPLLLAIAVMFPQFVIGTIPLWIAKFIALTAVMVYSMYLVLPSVPIRSGFFKVTIGELLVIVILLCYGWLYAGDIFQNLDLVIFSGVVFVALGLDFNGTTPTAKSGLGEFYYKRGATEMKFFTGSYKLSVYGEITLDSEKCVGCKMCLEVCPRNVYVFDESAHKAKLSQPEHCVNCSACVKQCLGHCLEIKPY